MPKDIKVAILYQNLADHIPDNRTLKDAVNIVMNLKTDFIWRLNDIAIYIPPESPETAYDQFRRAGMPDDMAKKWAYYARYRGWNFESFKQQVLALKKTNPNIIISFCAFAVPLAPKYIWDPVTLEPLSEEEIKSMALDLSKWDLPYDLKETQKMFKQHAPYWKDYWYPDITNPNYQDFVIKKAIRAIDCGADAVWFDMLFSQAINIIRYVPEVKRDPHHPAVEESFKGACEILNAVKKRGKLVGTWSGFLIFPYWDKANPDFITISVQSSEILNLKPDEKRWDKIITFIREKLGKDFPILVVIDFSPSDNAPLAVFSQKLIPAQQCRCLEVFDNFFTEKGVTFVYPVHGGDLGANAKILAYGKYRKYDALAPEFQTYETIKELALGKKRANWTPYLIGGGVLLLAGLGFLCWYFNR